MDSNKKLVKYTIRATFTGFRIRKEDGVTELAEVEKYSTNTPLVAPTNLQKLNLVSAKRIETWQAFDYASDQIAGESQTTERRTWIVEKNVSQDDVVYPKA